MTTCGGDPNGGIVGDDPLLLTTLIVGQVLTATVTLLVVTIVGDDDGDGGDYDWLLLNDDDDSCWRVMTGLLTVSSLRHYWRNCWPGDRDDVDGSEEPVMMMVMAYCDVTVMTGDWRVMTTVVIPLQWPVTWPGRTVTDYSSDGEELFLTSIDDDDIVLLVGLLVTVTVLLVIRRLVKKIWFIVEIWQ